ncbi:MAG: L-methionine/branched-chain amino acid transporter [Oceanospirillaceae bacterium]
MQSSTGTIGRWQGAGLMATTLLGTGVFILPQMTINIADAGALFAWILLTLAIIPITLVFARLASRFPHAAGPAYFVEKAFGNIAGRCIGLSFLLLIPMGSAAAILITFKFFYVLVPLTGIAALLVQLSLIAFLLVINIKGIHVSAKLQFFLTLTIVAIVVMLLTLSGFNSTPQKLSVIMDSSQLETVLSAAGIAFWSFLGVEAMTHLANDFRDPKKDLVPAMMIGTVLVGAIYIGCTYLLISIPNDSSLAMVDVFDQLVGGYGAQVIGVLGVASGLAVVNVYSAGISRLIWSFSREQVLPKYFDKLNQHQVPVRALVANLLTMAAAIIFTYATDQELEQLISWTNGVFVVIYAATMFAAIKLLSKKYLPLIICSLAFCVAVAISLGASMTYAAVILVILVPSLLWQKSYLSQKQAI